MIKWSKMAVKQPKSEMGNCHRFWMTRSKDLNRNLLLCEQSAIINVIEKTLNMTLEKKRKFNKSNIHATEEVETLSAAEEVGAQRAQKTERTEEAQIGRAHV